MGFAMARSIPSLVAGVSIGALYAVSGYLIQTNRNYGVELATATGILLTSAMLKKAVTTRKPVPVTMALVGTLSTIYYLRKWSEQGGV
jgi:uncharacterized membrane protein (UPF0136 family)